jgi:hypothetical protein
MSSYLHSVILISVLNSFNSMHADLYVIRGIQGEIWDEKGSLLQVAQMETEQAQNGPSIILSLLCSHLFFGSLQLRLQVDESLLANLYISFP